MNSANTGIVGDSGDGVADSEDTGMVGDANGECGSSPDIAGADGFRRSLT